MGELMDYTEPVDLSAYVPLAGGTWTGAMTLSGSFSGASSAHWLGKDANGPIFNVGSAGGGGALQIMSNGALNINLNETYGIVLYTNQTVASASTAAQICRTSGHFNINAQNGADVQIQSGGTNLAIFTTSQAYLGATTVGALLTCQGAVSFSGTQTSAGSSTYIGADGNGFLFNCGAAGGGKALQVFSGNALNTSINEKYGILFAADQTGAGGPTCQIYRTSGHLNVNGPYTGDVSLQTNSTTNLAVNSTGATFSAGVDIISPAAGFALRSPGVAFTNDGNWTNLYSLAAGTHNGRFYLSCALFAGHAILTVNGTSISLVTDEWGFADVTAASGKIAFRISGGYLQYNCGTGISSTPKYMHVDFVGIAR